MPQQPSAPQDILNPGGCPVRVTYDVDGKECIYKVPAGGVSYQQLVAEGIDTAALFASRHLGLLDKAGTLKLRRVRS